MEHNVTLRYRRMRSEDVDATMEFISSNPVFGPRYGKNISRLGTAVKAVLHLESVRAFVCEEISGRDSVRPFSVAIIGFVADEFARRATQPPFFWIGPEITRLTLTSQSPFLSDEELRQGNTLFGLNATTWLWGIGLQDILRMEVQKLAME